MCDGATDNSIDVLVATDELKRIRYSQVFHENVIRLGQSLLWTSFVAFHLWSVFLAYQHGGLLWAMLAFGAVPFTEGVLIFSCFLWGLWFYVLGCLFFVLCGSGLNLLEDHRSKLGVLLLVLAVSFAGIFCKELWGYVTDPSLDENAQLRMQDSAVGILSLVDGSTFNTYDPGINYPEVKESATKHVAELGKKEKAELVRLVNLSLNARYSIENDLFSYLRELVSNEDTIDFEISPRTARLMNSIPKSMQVKLGMESGDLARLAELTKTTFDRKNVTYMAISELEANRQSQWRKVAQNYKEILGLPMPSQLELDNSVSGENHSNSSDEP